MAASAVAKNGPLPPPGWGPLSDTDSALAALLKRLVVPYLDKHARCFNFKAAEEDISKQMEAVAWIFCRYICQELLDVQALDWTALCRKSLALQPRLRKFLRLTDNINLATLIEKKVKHAYETAQNAISPSSQNVENYSVTRVCTCLLNYKKDKCVLVLGGHTLGVWSFIEKGKDVEPKHETFVASQHDISDEELAFLAVQEQTGIRSNALQVEDSFVVHDCMNPAGGSTRFYIMSCHGTYDLSPMIKLLKVDWVSVESAFLSANCPLLVKKISGMDITPSVGYLCIRPFCALVKDWLTRKAEGEVIMSSQAHAVQNGISLEQSCQNDRNKQEKHAISAQPPQTKCNTETQSLGADRGLEAIGHPANAKKPDKVIVSTQADALSNGMLLESEPPQIKGNSQTKRLGVDKGFVAVGQPVGVKELDKMIVATKAHAVLNDISMEFSCQNDRNKQEKHAFSAEPPQIKCNTETQSLAVDKGLVAVGPPLEEVSKHQQIVNLANRAGNNRSLAPPLVELACKQSEHTSLVGSLKINCSTETKSVGTKKCLITGGEPGKEASTHKHNFVLDNMLGSTRMPLVQLASNQSSAVQELANNGDVQNIEDIPTDEGDVQIMEDTPKITESNYDVVVRRLQISGLVDGKRKEQGELKNEEELKEMRDEKSSCSRDLQDQRLRTLKQKDNAAFNDVGLIASTCSPQSSMKAEKQDERVLVNCTALASMRAAYKIIKKKQKYLSKEMVVLITEHQARLDSLHKQYEECNENMATLLKGNKQSYQLALKLSKNVGNEKISYENSVDQCEQLKLQTASPKPVVDGDTMARKRPFHMLKTSIQELNEVCQKNNWSLPTFGVHTVKKDENQNLYCGKVRIRGSTFEHSETGELSESVKEAKISAAACLLSTLHLLRARNGSL